MTTKIAIAGAKGRMGQNLIRSALSNSHTEVVGVFDISEIDQDFLDKMHLSHEVATNRESSFDVADVLLILHLQKHYLLLRKVLSQVKPVLSLEPLVLKNSISTC